MPLHERHADADCLVYAITGKEHTMFTALFTSQRLRLAAPQPEDQATFAAWTQDDEYMRLLDDDPVRPQSATLRSTAVPQTLSNITTAQRGLAQAGAR